MNATTMLTPETRFAHAMPEDVEARALAFLRSFPGINVAHSGATLFDHLKGVYDKLEAWGCDRSTALAGLFHSIYGTTSFRRQTLPLSARPRVAEVIGGEAEALAFAFCSLDTGRFTSEIMRKVSALAESGGTPLDRRESSLLHIFAANWLEQFPRMRARNKPRNISFFKAARALLRAEAAAEIDALIVSDPTPVQVCDERIAGAPAEDARRFVVLDDFVPTLLQLKLSALMEMNIWRYGWKAADTQTNHFFWHSHFAGDNDDGGEVDCEPELHDRALVAPVLELWRLIQQSIGKGHVPVRVYANGHTFGGDGHLHTDARSAGHYTSLYYAHPKWDINWGGETLFFNDSRDAILHAAFPKPGRLVHFSGTIPHAARSPARDCPALRSVIVIKSFVPPEHRTRSV